jgi:hypothetical protein
MNTGLKHEASLRHPSRSLDAQYIKNCVAPFRRRKPSEYKNKRTKNITLLDFLDRANLAAREPVTRMEQITSDHLDQWAATWKTNDLSTQIWRSYVAMFMKWCRTRDHIVKQPEFREKVRVRSGNRCPSGVLAVMCGQSYLAQIPGRHGAHAG